MCKFRPTERDVDTYHVRNEALVREHAVFDCRTCGLNRLFSSPARAPLAATVRKWLPKLQR